jgi:hypothetical protein
MSKYLHTRLTLTFDESESEKYKNDKEYISESLLDKFVYMANASNHNVLHLYYAKKIKKTINDTLGQRGYIGFSSSDGYNHGMDPELFEELEKEFQLGILAQEISNRGDVEDPLDPRYAEGRRWANGVEIAEFKTYKIQQDHKINIKAELKLIEEAMDKKPPLTECTGFVSAKDYKKIILPKDQQEIGSVSGGIEGYKEIKGYEVTNQMKVSAKSWANSVLSEIQEDESIDFKWNDNWVGK